MDGSNEAMIFTHFFIAWTLFGVLLIWIFLFGLLALRPKVEKKVEETSHNSSLALATAPEIVRTSTAQVQKTTLVNIHIHEETASVEAVPLA